MLGKIKPTHGQHLSSIFTDGLQQGALAVVLQSGPLAGSKARAGRLVSRSSSLSVEKPIVSWLLETPSHPPHADIVGNKLEAMAINH